MPLFENRIFRLGLLVVTIIVAYLWLRGLTNEETTSQSRDEVSTEELVDTPTFEPRASTEPVVAPPVDPPEPTDDSVESVLEYTIEPGDTLEAIAVKFNVSVQALKLANPSVVQGQLFAGDLLRILNASTDNTAGENPSADRIEGEEVTYFIEQGDTFGAIAADYRVSVPALQEANPTIDPANIFPGQELIIPPIGTGLPAVELTPEPTAAVVQRAVGEAVTHEVTDGDSLTYLASIYEVTTELIAAANPGVEPQDGLFIGQVLNIPPPQRVAE